MPLPSLSLPLCGRMLPDFTLLSPSSLSVAGSSLSPVFAEGRVEQFEKKRQLRASFFKVNIPFTIFIYIFVHKLGRYFLYHISLV